MFFDLSDRRERRERLARMADYGAATKGGDTAADLARKLSQDLD